MQLLHWKVVVGEVETSVKKLENDEVSISASVSEESAVKSGARLTKLFNANRSECCNFKP